MQQPRSLPFAESDNTDAVALRAAISVLQMQRDKSKRDLQELEKLKIAAANQPELFVKELAAGRLRQEASRLDPLQATFEPDSSDDDDSDDDDDAAPNSTKADPVFPKIPSMQNVFRAPPINWARYNIVGEPLDRMHEEQRLRPGQDDALRGTNGLEHVIAAPYSPFMDKVCESHPIPPRRMSHKPA